MEVFVARLGNVIFAIGVTGMILGNVNAQQADSDDISEYYGFEEIEIIKLDWGIKDLRVADFSGDGKDDLVTVIHDRVIIYPQD